MTIESPSDRRKFLDRMVSVIDPGHAGRCAAFDRANRQRMKLFRDGMYDEKWHEALEDVIASSYFQRILVVCGWIF